MIFISKMKRVFNVYSKYLILYKPYLRQANFHELKNGGFLFFVNAKDILR